MEQRLLQLTHQGQRCLLRLFPDPDGSARSFAQGDGFALETFGLVPWSLRPALELTRGLLGRLATTDKVVLDNGGVCLVLRSWPADLICPAPWQGPRSNLLSALAPEIPDLELADCLASDTPRRVVKREVMTEAEAHAQTQAWRQHGIETAMSHARSGPGFVLFAGNDEEALSQACAAEGDVHRRDRAGDSATRTLGALLGYPECCIEALLQLNRRDDFHVAIANIPPFPQGNQSPFTAWLNPQLTLLSHFPCSTACAPSIQGGKRILQLASESTPTIGDGWLEYARRIHGVDERGNYIAVKTTTPDDLRVLAAHQFVVGSGARVIERPDLVGAQLVAHRGGLQIDGSLRLVIASDHRGIPS